MAQIIIAEDDGLLRKLYRDLFAKTGFDVTLVNKAELVVDAAKEMKADLIFLDVNLAGAMDGFGALKALKADGVTKSIPVIMLTNEGHLDQMDKAKEWGAKDYIVKASIDPATLIDVARRYLPH